MSLVLFELGLKALKQGKGIGRSARKTSQNLVFVEFAHFTCRAFNNDIAQRNLPVATYGKLQALWCVAAHADDCGSVVLFHICLKFLFFKKIYKRWGACQILQVARPMSAIALATKRR